MLAKLCPLSGQKAITTDEDRLLEPGITEPIRSLARIIRPNFQKKHEISSISREGYNCLYILFKSSTD